MSFSNYLPQARPNVVVDYFKCHLFLVIPVFRRLVPRLVQFTIRNSFFPLPPALRTQSIAGAS